MTEPLRNTKYAKEIATAKLPSGSSKKSFVAIERIFVKEAKQIEIRFSLWEGSKLMPRALDLPEDELLSLMSAAIRAGVLSPEFTTGLRRALNELAPGAADGVSKDASELDRIQAHFHQLIRSRAGDSIGDDGVALPTLEVGAGTQDDPIWFPIDGMHGGFKYWWDTSAKRLRLMTESWSRVAAGSGQLHEVTASGASLLGEGFV